MTDKPDIEWSKLTYQRFAQLASDDRLSKYEKIGFPNSYREGFEQHIFHDICQKLPRLGERKLQILDIGPGCSGIPEMLYGLCELQEHRLHLVDSPEMLAQLPDNGFVEKHPGMFPDCKESLGELKGKVDVIICYSVFHYVFVDGNPFHFIDTILDFMAPGGECLIGDIPNASKRFRFFSSEAGIAFHKQFTGSDALPPSRPNGPLPGTIDDAVLTGLVLRARAAGADAYLMPQPPSLPMANRREDILIRRP
ncbi:class I SAM-dependent methyltransferase [Bradyrhizobium sp. S69]|uniref:class I SAM-dependent methyltransferase n=1 Tax=Bradyrhizobium sp. S69 TaxID=1641856 RepID=UPI00131BB214|nr:class I SAM-dependent methyltransferase [Bradyrhizobium sp. S69]